MSASLSRLRSFYGALQSPLLLHAMIKREFVGCIALLSPLAAASEPLLITIATIDTSLPILWLDGGNVAPEIPPQRLGFGQIIRIKGTADGNNTLISTIEDMGFLALISDEKTSARKERFELDEQGVFRVYPFAEYEQPHDTASDWTV